MQGHNSTVISLYYMDTCESKENSDSLDGMLFSGSEYPEPTVCMWDLKK